MARLRFISTVPAESDINVVTGTPRATIPFPQIKVDDYSSVDWRFYPMLFPVETWEFIWWRIQHLTAEIQLDFGTGLQVTRSLPLYRSVNTELDLMTSDYVDGIGDADGIAGTVWSASALYVEEDWNGSGGYLDLYFKLYFCVPEFAVGGATEGSERLIWTPDADVLPSVYAQLDYGITSPGVEYFGYASSEKAVTDAGEPWGATPFTPLYGGPVTFMGKTFYLGEGIGNNVSSSQVSIALTPGTYFEYSDGSNPIWHATTGVQLLDTNQQPM